MRDFDGAAARVGTMSSAGRKWNANKHQLESGLNILKVLLFGCF